MNAIIDRQRYMEEAELLRNLRGDYSASVEPLDVDSIISNAANDGSLNHIILPQRPNSLETTGFGFVTQTINGQSMTVYDDPVGTYESLIQRQGNSEYDMHGTCGLCQCANVLRMAGLERISESGLISAALHSSEDVLSCLDVFNDAMGERGGTTVAGREEILAAFGIQTYPLRMRYRRGRAIAHDLAEAVQTGHGVIVSVDVARLWRNGQRGGHAISLISVTDDGNTFIYSDTGAGEMGVISAHDLVAALTGRPANITTNIIR